MGKESKSSRAQIEAHKRYDAKRAGLQVSVRLAPEELEKLDMARGDESRSAYVLRILRSALRRK